MLSITLWHWLTCACNKKKSLENEIVLITGGGHGLGKELAKLLARHLCTVVLWDINPETVFATASEIQNAGGKAKAYICDVSKENEVNFVADLVRTDVGDVSIVINNAGILQNFPFLQLDSKRIQRNFDINIIAHFWILRAFLPRMVELNHGHIVAISSAAGLFGCANMTDYCATKYGVVGLMESLAEEMRLKNNGIAFTTICPFAMDTGLIHHTTSRQPLFAPIYQPSDIASRIIDDIRKESRIVSYPSYVLYYSALQRFLHVNAYAKVQDFINYCRTPNEATPSNQTSNQVPEIVVKY